LNGGEAASCSASIEYWYSSSYPKRKSINISSSEALTNFQVSLNIAYDSDMQADFDDLRFAANDKTTLLSYYIESKTDSSTAKVWVKVPSLATGSNNIYMYYGNASATSASSGTDTFDFFDDFNTGSSPSSHWTVVEGSWSINSQQLLSICHYR
jgi:hypothetical protein